MNWSPGEPNDFGRSEGTRGVGHAEGEDVVEIRMDLGGAWNDDHVGLLPRFVDSG